jgi:molybdopterin/thiamine biosynthesis adenylyltransferase
MIFFSRNKNRMNSYRQNQYDSREFIVSMTERDYGELQLCDAALKVWLPDNVMRMLYEITVLLDVPISDFIRQLLFVHLYGKYDLLGYIERSGLQFRDPDCVDPCAKTISATEATPVDKITTTQGNMVIALKICMPKAMKKGLLDLAKNKYQPISEYIRRLIITHLLGHQESFPTPPKRTKEGL